MTSPVVYAIIKVQKQSRKELKIMFIIDIKMRYEEFKDYREAELWCAEHGVHPEEIIEE